MVKIYPKPLKSDIIDAIETIRLYAELNKYVIVGDIKTGVNLFPAFNNVHFDSKSLMKRLRRNIQRLKTRPTLSRCNYVLELIYFRVYKLKTGVPYIKLNPYQQSVIDHRNKLKKLKEELLRTQRNYKYSKLYLKGYTAGRTHVPVIYV